MGRDERRGEERWGEEGRREGEKGGSHYDNDSPLPSLDVCSSITYIVRLISVAMGTLADSIWPDPQPEGDVFLVLNNRKNPGVSVLLWQHTITTKQQYLIRVKFTFHHTCTLLFGNIPHSPSPPPFLLSPIPHPKSLPSPLSPHPF